MPWYSSTDSLFRQGHDGHGEAAEGYLVATKLARGGRLEGSLLVDYFHVASRGARNGRHPRAKAFVHQQHLVLDRKSVV